MKPLRYLPLLLASVWLNQAGAETCTVQHYVGELAAGRPSPGTLPSLEGCANDLEGQLAAAVVDYLARAPRQNALTTAKILEDIREAHRAANRPTMFYDDFARALVSNLAAKKLAEPQIELPDLSAEPVDAPTKLRALDSLIAQLKLPPSPSPPPPPTTSPSPSAAESRPKGEQVPPTSPLPVTALVALGLGLVNAAALSLLVSWLRKRQKQEAEIAQQQHRGLSDEFGSFKQFVELRVAEVPPLATKLEQLEGRISGVAAAAEALRAGSVSLGELQAELSLLWSKLSSLSWPASSGTDSVALALNGWLELEREALREAWQRFSEGSRDAVAAVEAALHDTRWAEIQADLQRLAQSVPADLRPTCDATLAPAREFFHLASKIKLAAKLAAGLASTGSEAKDLLRLRECAAVLTMIQGSSLVAERLGFRLERWVGESFVGLADLILQRFQQAQQAGDTSSFEEVRGAALRFLKLADLQPVDIVLGRTPFDGAQHIGRSTACRPDVPNGVIVGVVRNGFVRGGQQVVRQPEVVVNRLG